MQVEWDTFLFSNSQKLKKNQHNFWYGSTAHTSNMKTSCSKLNVRDSVHYQYAKPKNCQQFLYTQETNMTSNFFYLLYSLITGQ